MQERFLAMSTFHTRQETLWPWNSVNTWTFPKNVQWYLESDCIVEIGAEEMVICFGEVMLELLFLQVVDKYPLLQLMGFFLTPPPRRIFKLQP